MAHAEGTFENQGWDENTLVTLEDGKISRASVKQRFTGDISGTGDVDWEMYYRPDGTASFVALYRLTADIGERSGTIVMQTTGAFDGNEARGDWLVLGGTAGLSGITGTGSFAAPMGPNGSYQLDYEL